MIYFHFCLMSARDWESSAVQIYCDNSGNTSCLVSIFVHCSVIVLQGALSKHHFSTARSLWQTQSKTLSKHHLSP